MVSSISRRGVSHKPNRIKTGSQGASAYQIAVVNGFVGTEVEWLASLAVNPQSTGIVVSGGGPDTNYGEATIVSGGAP